jgi:hypothetical protein
MNEFSKYPLILAQDTNKIPLGDLSLHFYQIASFRALSVSNPRQKTQNPGGTILLKTLHLCDRVVIQHEMICVEKIIKEINLTLQPSQKRDLKHVNCNGGAACRSASNTLIVSMSLLSLCHCN